MNFYESTSTIAGPLSDNQQVQYRTVFSHKEKTVLGLLGVISVLSGSSLLAWLFWPTSNFWDHSRTVTIVTVLTMVAMASVEVIRMVLSATLWIFASKAVDPIPILPAPNMRVAVLTTIVPDKEPLDLVLRTLRAMKRLESPSNMSVDVWLLDEGNSPEVKAACEAIGVNHFSRKGVSEFNQAKGEFRARTKHGNHNAWRHLHEDGYDVVAQMDPDHVPKPNFLTRTVGYFTDPDVGFVVAPQVYGNVKEGFIAHGSAFQAYVFHGIIQRGGNGMEAPLLIGTNHVYRTSTFRQIGGYQDCITEDHLTSMVVYAATNPNTGKHWKGVYTPDILAVGEGPTSFTDYFNQQKRWTYGVWQILLNHSSRLFPQMRSSQRLSFILLQFFYPSMAVSWIISNCVTAIYLFGGVSNGRPLYQWAAIWGASMASSLSLFFWLRRFNLVEHERKDWGLSGMALQLMCLPVYVVAAATAVTRRPLSYVVTAKGGLQSPDSLKTFRNHLFWALGFGAVLVVSLLGMGSSHIATQLWVMVPIAVCVSPVIVHCVKRWKRRSLRSPSRSKTGTAVKAR